MRRLVLGVIGHVDHGKTALVRALTGMETDRLPEERRRGISIALGFAHLVAPDRSVDLIDMPGHERFVRTMVSGATGLDAALLVVAANEGIQPQTVEHVDIAALLGVRRALIAITKADLADPGPAQADAAALLHAAGIAVEAVIATSSLRGDGIDGLRRAILDLGARDTPAEDGVVFLPIDRAFTVPGHGTVVTGTLRGAAIAAGDALALSSMGRAVRVRSVQVHGAAVAQAAPGQRVAVNLRDVGLEHVPRGAVLSGGTGAEGLGSARWLTVALRSVATAPELVNGMSLQALLGTTEVAARLRLLERAVLAPGESGLAQLHCAVPVTTPARERVVLRLPSPACTVAGGRVIEPQASRRRRHDPAALAHLAALAVAAPSGVVGLTLDAAGGAGVSLAGLSRLSALAPGSVLAALAAERAVVGAGQAVSAAALDIVADAAASALAGVPNGLSRQELLAVLPGTGPAVLDAALQRLTGAGTLREGQGRWLIPRPDADRARARVEASLSGALAELLRQGGLTPPDPASLMTGLEQKRALDRLLREGVIVRAHDSGQKRDVLFHQEAIEEARRRLQPLLARPPGLLVSEAGAALGISRKYSVPLLAHLDEIRFTRRVQDRRILALATP